MNIKDKRLWAGAIIVIILIVVFYVYKAPGDSNNGNTEIPEVIGLSDDTINLSDDNSGDDTETIDNVVNPINTNLSIPVPNLSSPIVFTTDLSQEAKDLFKDKIEAIRATLRGDSNLVDDWIVLGTYYKATGDFDKTIEVWEYANLLQPTNNVPLQNLADLYGYYLKDTKKAEELFLEAIAVDPTNTYLYVKTSQFYIDFFGDKKKALDILNKGLEKSPGAQDIEEAIINL